MEWLIRFTLFNGYFEEYFFGPENKVKDHIKEEQKYYTGYKVTYKLVQ